MTATFTYTLVLAAIFSVIKIFALLTPIAAYPKYFHHYHKTPGRFSIRRGVVFLLKPYGG